MSDYTASWSVASDYCAQGCRGAIGTEQLRGVSEFIGWKGNNINTDNDGRLVIYLHSIGPTCVLQNSDQRRRDRLPHDTTDWLCATSSFVVRE